MSLNKTKHNKDGNITYSNEVVKSIIKLAALEIQGVAGLCAREVACEVNDDSLTVDVFMNVSSGVSCSDVAYRVQENIKRNVESTTDYKVEAINVTVMGVDIVKD